MMIRTSDITEMAMYMPRPRRRAEEMLQALLEGRSVVWGYPESYNPEPVMDWISLACADAGLRVETVDVEEDVGDPEGLLMALYGDRLPDDFRPDQVESRWENLLDKAPHVMLLRRFPEKLDEELGRVWARFIGRWIQYAKRAAGDNGQPKALFILASDPGLRDAIPDDPYLFKCAYWGWLGEMEMRVLLRELAHQRAFDPADRRWMEASFVGIVGSDLDLLQWLVDRCEESYSFDSLQACLAAYGESRGWHELPEGVGDEWTEANGTLWPWRNRRDDYFRQPPLAALPLWSMGVLEKDRFEGVFVHSALLALRGHTHVIGHRMWRGQAREFLPMLDALRLELCRFLSARYPTWKTYEYPGKGVGGAGDEEAAGDTRLDEYPALAAFIDGLRWEHRSLGRFFKAVQSLRRCRNELAHYRALSRDDFDRLWRAMETVRAEVRGA